MYYTEAFGLGDKRFGDALRAFGLEEKVSKIMHSHSFNGFRDAFNGVSKQNVLRNIPGYLYKNRYSIGYNLGLRAREEYESANRIE